MRESYARGMRALYWACVWIAGASIVVMTLVIPWGVFTRYVLGTGSSWPEPLAIQLMVIFTFFGAAACYRANAHIAVALFKDMLPGIGQRVLAVVVDILMALLAVFMIAWGFQLCRETWDSSIAEFPWLSVGLSYSPLPIGSIVTLLFIVEHLWCGPAKDLAEGAPQEISDGAELN
jgi:TRAP-type C4-dicarboxylate transport system permease small subunit